MGFQELCPAIAQTELWRLLTEKAGDDHIFLADVENVCIHGITLAKDIIRFFPTFTLHDETHIINVCGWMARLLGEQKRDLSVQESALLIMSACCHDIGMSVSKQQEADLLSGRTDTVKWTEYFKSHRTDELAFLAAGKDAGLDGEGKLTPEILRNYIRVNHHTRIINNLSIDWPDSLKRQGITRQLLADLCRSHGEPLNKLRRSSDNRYDLILCAVLLRLSDLLDFDTSRAPDILLHHLGLDHPVSLEERISAAEWSKNRAGVFGPVSENVLNFTAGFDNLQQEKEVQVYLDYVQNELRECSIQLHRQSERWKNLSLPYTISTEHADRRGYCSGNFRLTMDQDKVIKLLTGKNLYTDAGNFVRELLQNAIDAILFRATVDPRFEVEDGHIVIRTWIDRNGNSWFRMEDNGIGMDQHTIENYFLKVGRSYYTSDEFQLDKLHYGKKTDAGQENYTPISRFGIGFLSCFMSDPDYNQVQVSTKRYTQDSQNPNPGIRLDVTSLNGYYYLAVEGEQEEWEENFTPMAHPEDADRGYRGEVGTTICVRANLYRMGGYRSFQEIVDKYLCFPIFRVEYFGPEGAKVYQTHKELMDAVHNMNPDGQEHEPRKYLHPIPDEAFERLKECTPDTKWNEKPSIILQYYPLDWYSNSGNISGYFIKATVNANTSIEPFIINEKEYYPDAQATFYPVDIDNGYHLDYRYSFSRLKNYGSFFANNELRIRRMRSGEGSVYIDKKIVDSWILEDSFMPYFSCMSNHSFFNRISYNNVTAEIMISRYSTFLDFYDHSFVSYQFLFSGPYILDTGMDRSRVSSIQPEALCECALIAHRTDCFSVYNYTVESMTSDTFWSILNTLNGEAYFEYKDDNDTILSLQEIRDKLAHSNQTRICVNCNRNYRDLYHDICIAAIQKEYVVCIDTKRRTNVYTIMARTPDEKIGAFPYNLFRSTLETDMPLCVFQIHEYNQDHPFSRWLIQNQVELQSRTTGLYNDLLAAMLSYYETKVAFIADVNSILNQLRSFQDNFFNISDGLFLSEADISDCEEEDE